MVVAPQDVIRVLGDSQIHALRPGARDKLFKGRFQIDFIAPGRMIHAFIPPNQDEASTSVRASFFRKIRAAGGPIAFSFGGGEHARTWTYSNVNRWYLGDARHVDDPAALTSGILEAYFDYLFRDFIDFIAKQINASGVPGALLSFPPVVADTKLLLTLREAMAAKTGSKVRLDLAHTTPSELRRDVWALTERVKRRLAAEHGLDYVPPPPSALTSDGFLRPEFVGDAFHANADYGYLILQTLVDWPWKKR